MSYLYSFGCRCAFVGIVFLWSIGGVALAQSSLGSSEYFSNPTGALNLQSGPAWSVAYPVAQAICRVLNQDSAFSPNFDGSRCRVSRSSGALQNRQALQSGTAHLALVPYNFSLSSSQGLAQKTAGLSNLVPLFQESLYVLAKASSGIENLDMLRGRTLHIGNKGSNVRLIATDLLKDLAWTEHEVIRASYSASAEPIEHFCSSSAEVAMVLSGHPSALVKYLSASCDLRLVPLTSAELEVAIFDQEVEHRTVLDKAIVKSTVSTNAVVENAITPGLITQGVLGAQHGFRANTLLNDYYTLDGKEIMTVSRMIVLAASHRLAPDLLVKIKSSLQRYSESLMKMQPVLRKMNTHFSSAVIDQVASNDDLGSGSVNNFPKINTN